MLAGCGITELLRHMQILLDGNVAELFAKPGIVVLQQMRTAEALAGRECEDSRQHRQRQGSTASQ